MAAHRCVVANTADQLLLYVRERLEVVALGIVLDGWTHSLPAFVPGRVNAQI